MQGNGERRTAGSAPMRPGALRCSACGTTWFDPLAELFAGARVACRRCGGALHTERRRIARGPARVVAS